jgi:hypothetical protein
MFIAFLLGTNPDHGIRPRLSEAPGLFGGEFQHGAVLGVVEDSIVTPGLREVGRRFGEGRRRALGARVVGSLDLSGEFEAVRFTVAEVGPNFE